MSPVENFEFKNLNEGFQDSESAFNPNKIVIEKPPPDWRGSPWEHLKGRIEPIEWDWPGWLPRGLLTILASEPGMGKSQLCLRLAASFIEGQDLPDGQPYTGERGSVVWCESEGSHALNMARAEAWGIGLTEIVSPLRDPFHSFNIGDDQHLANLLHLCRRPEVRLVVLDSLTGLVVPGTAVSTVSETSIKGIPMALHYLGELARITGQPILLTHHLRKRTTLDRDGFINLDRIRGTSKIAQTARVVWTLDAPNEADRAHRRLAVAKNNLMPLADPLGMRLTDSGPVFGEPPVVGTGLERVRVVDEAAEFLVDFLGDGVVASGDVLEAGMAAGFSMITLKRAKVMLGVRSKRMVGRMDWGWYREE